MNLSPIRRALVLAGALLFAGLCHAQAWPARPVRLIVPYPVGTANEVFARVVAQKLAELWHQPIVVDPIVGAGGVVGTQVLAKAAADGYTLGWVSSPHAINPAIYHSLPYDSVRDFKAIVNIASTPLVFVAGTGFGGSNIAGLIAMAKAKPGQINFGSNGNGSASHLATELLASMAGVRFAHVPYKSTGQMTTDLLSGQIQFAALGVVTSQSLINSGKLKPLGVTSAKRAPLLPDVAAVGETVPGYETNAWMGLVAPTGVPDVVVARVQADIAKVVADPTVLAAMNAQGLDVELLDSKAFAARIAADIQTWRKIVSEAGIETN
jgi:tripartite-type tricarboxylate transporter receptor subunit TctC